MDAENILKEQKIFLNSGKTKDLSYRINQLKKLKKSIKFNESKILKALKDDLNKSYFEGYETDVGLFLDEIDFIIKNLKSGVKPKSKNSSISFSIFKLYI